MRQHIRGPPLHKQLPQYLNQLTKERKSQMRFNLHQLLVKETKTLNDLVNDREHYSTYTKCIYNPNTEKTSRFTNKNHIIHFTKDGDSQLWANSFSKPSNFINPLQSTFWTGYNQQPIQHIKFYLNKTYSLNKTLPGMSATIKNTIIALVNQGATITINMPCIPEKTFSLNLSKNYYREYKQYSGQYKLNLHQGIDPKSYFYKQLTKLEYEIRDFYNSLTVEYKQSTDYRYPEDNQNLQHIYRWAPAYDIDTPPMHKQNLNEFIELGKTLNTYLRNSIEINDTHRLCSCGYPITPIVDQEKYKRKLKTSKHPDPENDNDTYTYNPSLNQEYYLLDTIPCPKCGATYKLDDFYPIPDKDPYLDYTPKPTWRKPSIYKYTSIKTADYFCMI